GLDAGPLMPSCLDEMTGRAFVNRIIKAYAKVVEHDPWVLTYVIEYVLGTGRNWKGPIGEFKLRIKKWQTRSWLLVFPASLKRSAPRCMSFARKILCLPTNSSCISTGSSCEPS